MSYIVDATYENGTLVLTGPDRPGRLPFTNGEKVIAIVAPVAADPNDEGPTDDEVPRWLGRRLGSDLVLGF